MATFIVDDRDPSITHSGSWRGFSDDLAYNHTLTWLGTAGTAKISFIGSGIGVHGTNYADSPGKQLPPECLYSIDEGTPVRLIVNRTATTTWGELFFQSPDLPKTSHVLTIEYADNHRIKDVLVLDYFIVNDGTLPGDPSSLTTPPLSSTATSLSTTPNLSPSLPYSMESSSPFSRPEFSSPFSTLESSSSSSSPTSGATPTRLATDLVQVGTMTKLPIGPIIGGALGTLTFICTVLLILYLRRRWREGHSDKNIGAPPRAIGRPQISPYDIYQHPQDDGRGKPLVDTRMGMTGMTATQVTTSSVTAETVQRIIQQALAEAITPSTLSSRMDPNDLGGTVPIPEDIDPPPSYLQR